MDRRHDLAGLRLDLAILRDLRPPAEEVCRAWRTGDLSLRHVPSQRTEFRSLCRHRALLLARFERQVEPRPLAGPPLCHVTANQADQGQGQANAERAATPRTRYDRATGAFNVSTGIPKWTDQPPVSFSVR